MRESIFEVFSAEPTAEPKRVDADPCFSTAFDRMREIARRQPGRYFLFCRANQKVLVTLETPFARNQPNVTWLI